jgi:hypothetical protein
VRGLSVWALSPLPTLTAPAPLFCTVPAARQTLFMLGEDSHTCMGIRARQKGTNRGLLSILLHGNCRILGLKVGRARTTP